MSIDKVIVSQAIRSGGQTVDVEYEDGNEEPVPISVGVRSSRKG